MAILSIKSNSTALAVQRRLNDGSTRLSRVYERLSSGQRINRASDDAAGLAIASSLKADGRVYNQAIRNANDGISALNIAEGALSELAGIVTRIKELAEQSANGVYRTEQREPLNAEAQALRDEYSRIATTTSFNGISLLASRNTLSLQVDKNSYSDSGENHGALSITIGSEFGVAVGDGTFEGTPSTSLAIASTTDVDAADFNGDGIVDLIGAQFGGLQFMAGNGDGTYQAAVGSNGDPGFAKAIQSIVDLNNDGNLDVVAGAGSETAIYLGNGDGSFTFSEYFGLSGGGLTITADINNDGFADLLTSDETNSQEVRVYLNDQDGTFTQLASVSTGGSPNAIFAGDLNGDSYLDLVARNVLDGDISVHLGDGTGGFTGGLLYDVGLGGGSTGGTLADFNNDGYLDYADVNLIALGNGNGTFGASQAIAGLTGGGSIFAAPDLNSDGLTDLVTVNGSTFNFYLNNGDATFTASDTVIGAETPIFRGLHMRDLDGDGVLDLIYQNTDADQFSAFLANSSISGELTPFSLLTQQDSRLALDSMSDALNAISTERAGIGAMQSRLSYAVRNLASRSENVERARSQIVDADIASESATLVKTNILQQAGAAVLAQANQIPALALSLLRA
ncbi:MAG: VCBS repeat-containing protein [Bdellovibrionales bacterium]|nr:VCBS repeat-containing protein [Bdellovibrionales bacterium]